MEAEKEFWLGDISNTGQISHRWDAGLNGLAFQVLILQLPDCRRFR